MSQSSYFVSDLHLFARRSLAERYEARIHEALRRSHTFIFGGDIFDFRWSTLPDLDATAEAAVQWLERVVAPNEHCRVHFILGNHDSHARFVPRLQELSERVEHLTWHRYFLREDDCLFLHGDVADRHMTPEQLENARRRCAEHRPVRDAAHWIYEGALHARLHKMVNLVMHRRMAVARRLIGYMEQVGQGPDSGVRDVYFGHTHSEMDGFQFAGVRFHNGGAPMRGLRFRLVETTLRPNSVSRARPGRDS